MKNLFILNRPARHVVSTMSRNLATKIEDRNPKFSRLTDKDQNFFESLLTKQHCITDSNMLHEYNNDWLKICQGNSKLALLPTSKYKKDKQISNEYKLNILLKSNRRTFSCTQILQR